MRIATQIPAAMLLILFACAVPPIGGTSNDAGPTSPDGGTGAQDASLPDGGSAPDAGGAISCNPASVSQFLGTCLGTAFACFSPVGTCTAITETGTDTSQTTFMWSGGATIMEMGGTDAPFGLTVAEAGGQACAKVEAAHGGTGCGQGQSTYEVLNASNAVVATLCWVPAGPSTVHCPDGSSLTVQNDSMNRILDCLPVAPAVAQCNVENACPAGDAGPSPSCCQPNGNICNTSADCCSGNCILRGSPGFCCESGGCP